MRVPAIVVGILVTAGLAFGFWLAPAAHEWVQCGAPPGQAYAYALTSGKPSLLECLGTAWNTATATTATTAPDPMPLR
jgi:hypothetical protein